MAMEVNGSQEAVFVEIKLPDAPASAMRTCTVLEGSKSGAIEESSRGTMKRL